MSDTIPEGYELAEVSHAKNYVESALETVLEREGCEEGLEYLIELADAAVEALLKVGVTVPADLPQAPGYFSSDRQPPLPL